MAGGFRADKRFKTMGVSKDDFDCECSGMAGWWSGEEEGAIVLGEEGGGGGGSGAHGAQRRLMNVLAD